MSTRTVFAQANAGELEAYAELASPTVSQQDFGEWFRMAFEASELTASGPEALTVALEAKIVAKWPGLAYMVSCGYDNAGVARGTL